MAPQVNSFYSKGRIVSIGLHEPPTTGGLCKRYGKVVSQSEPKQTADIEDFSLTRMELVGLTLAANGYPAQDIATRIGVNEREIETLLFCAERKLGANNRLHAVSIAVSQGLIGIEV